MSAVADWLKGTVSESLKKLVQPAGLVPAALLVLLNLGFLYPSAKADGVPIAARFGGLDEKWQIVVLAVLIFGIGYLLLHSANWIIAILSGQTWPVSGASWFLRLWQLHQYNDLQARLQAIEADVQDNPNTPLNRATTSWELRTRFPSREPVTRYIQPTRLGNTMVATQHIILERYGIDTTALWSQMESVKELKDAPAIEAAKDEKATLDLLANLVFVLGLFTLEAVMYYGYRQRWESLLKALLVLPLAYLAYRVTDNAARSWGNGMEVAFDLHRDKLRDDLGLRVAKGFTAERAVWEKASTFFRPDAAVSAGDLFDVPPAQPDVTAAASLNVTQIEGDVVDIPREKTATADRVEATLRWATYVFVVSRVGDVPRFAGASFVVSDARLAPVHAVPDVIREGGAKATPTELSSAGRSRLEWRVTGLAGGESMTVHYRLPLWTLRVRGVDDAKIEKLGERFSVKLENGGGRRVSFEFVRAAAGAEPPALYLQNTRLWPKETDRPYAFDDIDVPQVNPEFFIALPKEAPDGT